MRILISSKEINISFEEVLFFIGERFGKAGKLKKILPKQISVDVYASDSFIGKDEVYYSRETRYGFVRIHKDSVRLKDITLNSQNNEYKWRFLRSVTSDFFCHENSLVVAFLNENEQELKRLNWTCEVQNYIKAKTKECIVNLSLLPRPGLRLDAYMSIHYNDETQQKIFVFSGDNIDILRPYYYLYSFIKINKGKSVSVFSKYHEIEFRVNFEKSECDIFFQQQFVNRPPMLLKKILEDCRYSVENKKNGLMPYLWYWFMPGEAQKHPELNSVYN